MVSYKRRVEHRAAPPGYRDEVPPGARDSRLLLGDVGGVEEVLVEEPWALDRREIRVDDVLRPLGVAADVPFGLVEEPFGLHLTKDEGEVEVGIDYLLDLATADLTEITLIASRHTEVNHRVTEGTEKIHGMKGE